MKSSKHSPSWLAGCVSLSNSLLLLTWAVQVYCVQFSPDGTVLAAGCASGHMYIYGLDNGKWAQVAHLKHHTSTVRYISLLSLYLLFYQINVLSFSPSGRMLLAAGEDKTASIWKVPSDVTWPSTLHVTFKGPTLAITCGAFLGDESHVVTGSPEKILRVWRTSDGVQTAKYDCGKVCHFMCLFLVLTLL